MHLRLKGKNGIPIALLLALVAGIGVFASGENFPLPLTPSAFFSIGEKTAVVHYEVESEENALDEATEEKIEDDLSQLSPAVDEEGEATESATIPEEEIATSPSEPPPAKKPVTYERNGLRIGFVTDIHVSSRSTGKDQWAIGSVFNKRIAHIVQQMNDVLVPDFIVVNGDVIEGTRTPSPQGMEELRQTKKLFDHTDIPTYWAIGNHDVRSVNKLQWKEALDIDYTRKSFLMKGYKIIIMDSNFNQEDEDVEPGPGNAYTRGRVSDKDIRWLKKELKSPEKKIVFIHHPPLRGIEKKPDIHLLKNAVALRELFSDGNVLGVFSGHIEDLYSEKQDGVRYFVFPGMTKSPDYPGNFVSIDIDGDSIRAEMSYIGKNNRYITIDIQEEDTDTE